MAHDRYPGAAKRAHDGDDLGPAFHLDRFGAQL